MMIQKNPATKKRACATVILAFPVLVPLKYLALDRMETFDFCFRSDCYNIETHSTKRLEVFENLNVLKPCKVGSVYFFFRSLPIDPMDLARIGQKIEALAAHTVRL